MSEELDFVFTGESAKECNDFIQAVRKYARANGKARDNIWIAEEVSDALIGEALWWYWQQTDEVQKDWRLLQKALVIQWLNGGEDGGNDHQGSPRENAPSAPPPAQGPIPIPAAAASSANSSDLSGKTGRLRIRTGLLRTSDMFLSKSTYYSGPDTWRLGAFLLTSDPKAAMHVKLMAAGGGLWRLEMLAHPSGRKLVVASFHSETASNSYGWLVGVDIPYGAHLKDHDSTYFGNGRGQFQTAIWRLEDEGYLSLVWSDNANDKGEPF